MKPLTSWMNRMGSRSRLAVSMKYAVFSALPV